MRRTGGNPKRYELLLRKFAESAERGRNSRRASRGDTATAARAAHSLKGAAANLGATAVADAAAEVETAIESGQGVAARAGFAGHLASRGCTGNPLGLADEQVAVDGGVAPPIPPRCVAPLRKLTKLLSNDDGDAADFILDAQPDFAKVLTAAEIATSSVFVGNLILLAR